MKKLLWCLAILGVVAVGSPASAASMFSGPYAPANWTLTNSPGTIDGSVNTGGAPGSITLTGGNNGIGGFTEYTTTAAASGMVSFNWLFDGEPVGGITGPQFDPSGYVLNGVFTQFTDNNGPEVQNGFISFNVNAGDTFGFRVNTIDGIFGPGILTISNFDAPTPEPATMAVFGLMAAGAYVRRRKMKA